MARRPSKTNTTAKSGEIYLEFRPVGHAIKVSAVDAATGIEISISGPKTTPQHELERIAVQKLKYVLSKR